ncbi:MAG: response regulator [Rhodospirillales bacterium]|nr:response regulator [Rhodospirillales bacterium]
MLTGQKEIDLAVEAMKAGAYDFLTKPVEKERLQAAIQNALTYFHGNMTQAATALGLAKSTLYRKLRPAAS